MHDVAPICASTGCRVANSSGLAPTMKSGSRQSQRPFRRNTAHRPWPRLFGGSRGDVTTVCGSMVRNPPPGTPLPMPAITPSSPARRSHVHGGRDMVDHHSVSSASSRAESADGAAHLLQLCQHGFVQVDQVSANASLDQFGAPSARAMLPRPINAIFMARSSAQVDSSVHAVVDASSSNRAPLPFWSACRTAPLACRTAEVAEFRTA